MEAVRAAKGGICLEWDVIKAVDATHRSITGITLVTLSLHKFEMVGLLKKMPFNRWDGLSCYKGGKLVVKTIIITVSTFISVLNLHILTWKSMEINSLLELAPSAGQDQLTVEKLHLFILTFTFLRLLSGHTVTIGHCFLLLTKKKSIQNDSNSIIQLFNWIHGIY